MGTAIQGDDRQELLGGQGQTERGALSEGLHIVEIGVRVNTVEEGRKDKECTGREGEQQLC